MNRAESCYTHEPRKFKLTALKHGGTIAHVMTRTLENGTKETMSRR